MPKLRLLLWETCHRGCPGCCNNDWDLKALPVFDATNVARYDEILLTGGEPMLRPAKVVSVSMRIKGSISGRIAVYMYTAKTDDTQAMLDVLEVLDGACITLHDDADVEPVIALAVAMQKRPDMAKKSMRLNVFRGVNMPFISSLFGRWKIKWWMEWQKNCPLPPDEVFMRLE